MKLSLDEAMKWADRPLTTAGRHIEMSDGTGGFDVLAGCVDDDHAALLAHAFNHLLKLRNLLAEQIELPDLTEVGSVAGAFSCRWCGRDYYEEDIPQDLLCPSDDCPGHQIRKALNEVNQVEVP